MWIDPLQALDMNFCFSIPQIKPLYIFFGQAETHFIIDRERMLVCLK